MRKHDSNMILRSKHDETHVLTIGQLDNFISHNEIISLIKEWRYFSGKGLKDSKDMIESLIMRKNPQPNNGFEDRWEPTTKDRIIDAFLEISYHPELTKEEFMNMISDAIDNKDKFCCDDMLSAVEFLFRGIKEKGGLVAIAKEHDKFLDAI